MTDPVDDQLREALHAEAGDAVASEEQLGRINARLARPARAHRRTWGAVAAAIALATGATIALRDGSSERTEVATEAPEPSTTDTAPSLLELRAKGALPQPCTGGPADVGVYMLPTATADELAAMRQRLDADVRINVFRYVDQAAAHADFRRLFDDEPELLDAVDPEDLPSAFMVDLVDEEGRPAFVDELSDHAGVHEIVSVVCGASEGPRPTLVALVREDGWLVTVDLITGEQRQLHSVGDPRDVPNEGGAHFIDGVDLSPDGEWIYFSTCCEPAPGVTFRIPVAGGEPERVGEGAYPRVSPDGRFVAVAATEFVWVYATGDIDGDLRGATASIMLDRSVGSVEWSPDGTQLAAVIGRGEDQAAGGPGVGQVALLSWDGTNLALADVDKPDNPASFASFGPDGTLVVTTGGPVDDDRMRSTDASRTWFLWVDEEGVTREQTGEQSGDRTPIVGLPEAIAADW